MQKQRRYDGMVMGPDGNPLTLDDLPPPDTTRWVIRRKAEVVAAVRGGLLTLEAACERYNLTTEEFESWRAAKRPVEFHFYEQGGHGFGMYPKTTTSTGWFDAFVSWMKMHGLLERRPERAPAQAAAR